MRRFLQTAVTLGVLSMSGMSTAQTSPNDAMGYFGGPVMSPHIVCLMWSPPDATDPFTSADKQPYQDYVRALQEYLSNQAAPQGTSKGAGTEPVPRQYGVWGAYFNGSCTLDTTTARTGLVDMNDNSATSVIASEISKALECPTCAYPSGVYSPNTIVLVFIRASGTYVPGTTTDARHWAIGSGQYIAVQAPDVLNRDMSLSSHEIIESATDPAFNLASGYTHGVTGWATPLGSGCGVQEACDDGVATNGTTLDYPLPDGFGSANQPIVLAPVIDNIDGFNGDPSSSCIGFPGLCAPIGNTNYYQCPQRTDPSIVYSGNSFTAQTTTPPVTVLQTGSKTNVIARTPTGILHMVSSDNGVSYVTVQAPVGAVSEIPSVYSKDGTIIDMWGRGYDGALYHWVYNGSSWSGPTGLGGYINGPPSAVYGPGSPGTQQDYAYALGTDGNLYAWSSFWYPVAMPPNVSAISPPQVFIRDSSHTCADIYFTGSDGNVYFSPCGGVWQTLPGSGGVNGFGLVNAVSWPGNSNRVEVFVKEPVGLGGSTTLWAEYQSGSLVNHSLLSTLPNSVGQIGAVNFGVCGFNCSSYSPVFLFFTSANQMYMATSTFTGTSYGNASVMNGTPLVTSPITAFSAPDSNMLTYARRQSDGHLIQVKVFRYVLQSQYFYSVGPVQDLGIAIM